MTEYSPVRDAATTIIAWMFIAFLFLLTAAGIKWAWGLLVG